MPPPPEHLERVLADFENYLHLESGLDPLVRAFLAHYQFEAIHPFRDGNGRVGRLLLALTISQWCHLSNQWLYMSAFFEHRKSEYMDLLLGVSTKGGWDEWIGFCLEGVIEQANDTEQRCDQLLSLHRDFNSRLKGGSVRLSEIVDGLFENPLVTVLNVKAAFNISYPTARSDLRKLEVLGIVQRLENTPTITYYCDPIFAITYADLAT